ncbi:hypothetical protein ABID59_001962 [Bradyrhizobium sp. S3.3.6]|uniref:YunG family protein n=1 Tax=Bradyrhizobium sp. S3.3.6 TaxID=3156429 RepID=UPI003395F31C
MDTSEPSGGAQCNVTALLIHELYGGDLLKMPLPAGDHFHNRIEGHRHEFTASQFDEPISYLDVPTSRAEAERGATKGELAELRTFQERHAKLG